MSEKINKENKNKNNINTDKKNKKNNKSGNKKYFFSFLSMFKKRDNIKNNNLALLETDLIKDEVPIIFEFRRHLIAFFVLLFVSFILIMELFFFLDWWEKNKNKENSYYLQAEINEIMKEKKEIEDSYGIAVDFKDKMNTSFSVLDKHIYWTNFFAFLENNTLRNVYFRNFSGDVSGSYILPATTDDVRAVSYQSRYFSSDNRTNSVSILDEEITEGGLSFSSGLVNFNIDLDLTTRIFNDLSN